MPTSEPHQHRLVAEAFGTDAERYDRSRPRYPSAVIERIVTALPGRDILDVGPGTGIEARQLQAAGCTVLGVEPDIRMADFARRRGLDVEVSTFETWDPAGRHFDAVVAGQSWHWVDPVAGAGQAARVLRPGGRLAVFWNVFQPPSSLVDGFAAVYREVRPDLPVLFDAAVPVQQSYTSLLDLAADGIRASAAFDEPQTWHVDWQRTYTREQWLDQVPTFGGHQLLAPAELGRLLTGLGDTIDAAGGSFTMAYTTVVCTARLL